MLKKYLSKILLAKWEKIINMLYVLLMIRENVNIS